MSRYDSESSDGEDEDYTETGVLLGYASKEPTEDNISQLGGYPTWLDPTTPPPLELAKCKVCNDLMSLLLQLNGDLPEHFPGHERRLYLFTCRRRTCQRKQGSIRGFRGVRVNTVEEKHKSKGKGRDPTDREEQATEPMQRNIGNDLFGTNAPSIINGNTNPFSTGSTQNTNSFSPPATATATATATADPFATSAPSVPPPTSLSPPTLLSSKPPQRPTAPDLPSTFAEKARLSTPPPQPAPAPTPTPTEPWPPQSSFPPPYPTYHLDADYETISKSSTPPLPTTHPNNFDIDDPSSSKPPTTTASDDNDNDPTFESTLDKPFLRFADRLAQNPLQVLRYEFRGSPLLYSKTDAVGKLFSLPSSSSPNANAKITTKSSTSSNSSSGQAGRVAPIPRCDNCGAQRVFELQLTPRAIVELEAEEVGLEGMEWGTVVLGVCGRDCWVSGVGVGEGKVGYVEEWVGVQWEEQVRAGGRR